MSRIDQYPMGTRVINTAKDFILGIISGQLADVPWSAFAATLGLSVPAAGVTGSRPASPAVGQIFFDTSLGQPVWCKQITPSVVWVNAAGVQV